VSRWLVRFNNWFNRQADRYKSLIGWALRHRLAMFALGTSFFAGAIALPAAGIVGGSFFPVQDVSEFTVVIETPPGSNVSYTRIKAEEAASLARAKSEVSYTFTTIGGTGGLGAASGAVDAASVYVRLQPKHERHRHQEDVAQELRQQLQRIAGKTVARGHETIRKVGLRRNVKGAEGPSGTRSRSRSRSAGRRPPS